MGVKKTQGDFFSEWRSFKESFYPRFLIKKLLYWPLEKGSKNFRFKKLLDFNMSITYTLGGCRRLDLLFSSFVFISLFRFRSTDIIVIRRRLKKKINKKVYGHLLYNSLEKSSTKLFSSLLNKQVLKHGLRFFFLFQNYFEKKKNATLS